MKGDLFSIVLMAVATDEKQRAFASVFLFELVSKVTRWKLVPFILLVLPVRLLELAKRLFGGLQFFKQFHLLRLTLQQLLLQSSENAVQFKNPLLHHAFITQGNHRLGDSKRGLCALYSTSNPIQHIPTPAIHGCEQKASTVKGAI
ncbi:hypothetical protein EA796_00840 [Pseudomonas sp. AOB-7]|nr:hypothetical protein EA796_00840 [Pseudomonas sp. AOB-7]